MAGNRVQVKTFACPACGGTVALHAAGHSVTAVCTHCSSVIDTANENFRIILKNHQRTRETDIPLGAKGTLDGVKWEVIGYVEKKDISESAFWEEYLLFNPYFGFRFLVQGDDHWSLASVIKRDLRIAEGDQQVQYDGEEFDLFYRSVSTVVYVKGEFYWRIRKGDQEKYFDYIAPPRMLSVEQGKQEITLSMAEYVLPREIEQAFGVSLSKRRGVAPNQPAPFAGASPGMWWIALFALLAAFLIQLKVGGREEVLGTWGMHVEQASAEKALSTPVFAVPRNTNLMVRATAPLNNNWMDMDLSLVDENSNAAYEGRQSLEYYSGVDEGYPWSEGSTQGETYFSAVQPGNYRLVLEPSAGTVPPEGIGVALEAREHVPVWGNFWLIAILILVVPAYAALHRRYFEHRRWSNSDYAPKQYTVPWDE